MLKEIDGKKYEIEISFSSNNTSIFKLILDEIEKENKKEAKIVD